MKRLRGKRTTVYMSVESPDVLEMVTDFLAGLLSALPTRKRLFIKWNESEGHHCSRLPLSIFHTSDSNCWCNARCLRREKCYGYINCMFIVKVKVKSSSGKFVVCTGSSS